MLPSFQLKLEAKLSPFNFCKKIDAIFIRFFIAAVAQLDPELSRDLLSMGVVQGVLRFIEIFNHIAKR